MKLLRAGILTAVSFLQPQQGDADASTCAAGQYYPYVNPLNHQYMCGACPSGQFHRFPKTTIQGNGDVCYARHFGFRYSSYGSQQRYIENKAVCSDLTESQSRVDEGSNDSNGYSNNPMTLVDVDDDTGWTDEIKRQRNRKCGCDADAVPVAEYADLNIPNQPTPATYSPVPRSGTSCSRISFKRAPWGSTVESLPPDIAAACLGQSDLINTSGNTVWNRDTWKCRYKIIQNCAKFCYEQGIDTYPSFGVKIFTSGINDPVTGFFGTMGQCECYSQACDKLTTTSNNAYEQSSSIVHYYTGFSWKQSSAPTFQQPSAEWSAADAQVIYENADWIPVCKKCEPGFQKNVETNQCDDLRCQPGFFTTVNPEHACTPCPSGKFKSTISASITEADTCEPYNPCAPGFEPVGDDSTLTTTADRVCRACAVTSNEYSQDGQQCISGGPKCPAGKYVSAVLTSSSARECTTCPAGKYKDIDSNNNWTDENGDWHSSNPIGCKLKTNSCWMGKGDSSPPDLIAIQNSVCADCVVGESFSDEYNGLPCKPVTVCPAGKFPTTEATDRTDQV